MLRHFSRSIVHRRNRRRKRGRPIGRSMSLQPLETRRLLAADVGIELTADQVASTERAFTRIVNGQTTSSFEAVGIVNNGCTGTLVTPQHVLTAALDMLTGRGFGELGKGLYRARQEAWVELQYYANSILQWQEGSELLEDS